MVAYGRAELDRLAVMFDVPINGKSRECRSVLGLVLHSHDIFRAAFRDSHRDVGTALLSLRALTEAAILVRWFEVSPKLHVKMWQADADRQVRVVLGHAVEMHRNRRWPGAPPAMDEAALGRIERRARRIRVIAIAHGESLGSKSKGCLPSSVEVMALQTKDSAIWEAYEIVYRSASPWSHISERLFAGYDLETRPDGVHIITGNSWTGRHVRALSVTLFAILLGSASRTCGLGFERECRVIQDGVATWPPEAKRPRHP